MLHSRWLRLCAVLLAMVLFAAACGEEDTAAEGEEPDTAEEPDTPEDTGTAEGTATEEEPEGTEDATDGGTESDAGGYEVADGVLQPLEDGFPDDPITFWNPFDVGSHNDVFNQVLAEVGEKYSPVPLTTSTQVTGAHLHWALVEFLETQPRSDEGYHAYGISWSGMALRRLSLSELHDVPLGLLHPINNIKVSPFIFVTRQDSEFETIEDVVAAAEERPGEIRVALASAGGNTHVSSMVFADEAGIELVHIPTGGTAEGMALLEGGGAEIGVLSMTLGIEDRFRVLMATGEESPGPLPEVPAASEFGWDIPVYSNFGVGTLQAVPDEHRDWLAELLSMIAEDDEFWEHYPSWDEDLKNAEEVEEMMGNLTESLQPVLEEAGIVD